jgi:metallo-beta-lactamase family protein
MSYPDILHHGAKDGVSGSLHQLLMGTQHSPLIDCGLFQGTETLAEGISAAERLAIEFLLNSIKALVATHVHIDHIGRISYLLAAGFKGPILCSEPSAKLLPIVLEDAFKLGLNRDQKQVERYIELIGQRIIALPYETGFTLHDTQSLVCRIRLGRLELVIEQALADNGTVLIAAFSIGRTQELLYGLEDIIHRKQLNAAQNHPLPSRETTAWMQDVGRSRMPEPRAGVRGKTGSANKATIDWPALPIFLDSPPVSCFTQVYRDLTPFWDNQALQCVKQGRNPLAAVNRRQPSVSAYGPPTDGNRSSGHRHRRERNVRQQSNRQLPEIHAARSVAQRSVRRLPGPGHHGPSMARVAATQIWTGNAMTFELKSIP